MTSEVKQILIISAVFPPEPVVSAMISYDLALKLSKIKPVVVLCPKPTRPKGTKYNKKSELNISNVKRVVLDSYTCPASSFIGRFKESISFGKATKRYIEDNYKNIACAYINTWPMFAQYMALDTLKKYHIPAVLHIQDIYPESMLTRLGFVGKLVKNVLCNHDRKKLSKASAFFAISENMKDYLCATRNFDGQKVSVIRNWQDDRLFSDIYELKEHIKFTFMYVGSLSPAAGVPFLIKTFGKANIKNARLIIAGNGSEKNECMNIATTFPEADISFCDVTPNTVPSVQAEADVLLLPLKKGIGFTASPSKLPAYMFSAKPVIACVDRGSDVDCIINESGGGWLCNPEDENELSNMMITIANLDKNILKEKGEKSRMYALEHFTRGKNLEKMVSVILNNIRS